MWLITRLSEHRSICTCIDAVAHLHMVTWPTHLLELVVAVVYDAERAWLKWPFMSDVSRGGRSGPGMADGHQSTWSQAVHLCSPSK
jgi:hypothetical protein